MTNIKEEALAYESQRTQNIVDLEIVPADIEIHDGSGHDGDGKEFFYKYILVEGTEYRVPNSVLQNLKAILESNPKLTKFKVTKAGEGMNTKYTVIPIL